MRRALSAPGGGVEGDGDEAASRSVPRPLEALILFLTSEGGLWPPSTPCLARTSAVFDHRGAATPVAVPQLYAGRRPQSAQRRGSSAPPAGLRELGRARKGASWRRARTTWERRGRRSCRAGLGGSGRRGGHLVDQLRAHGKRRCPTGTYLGLRPSPRPHRVSVLPQHSADVATDILQLVHGDGQLGAHLVELAGLPLKPAVQLLSRAADHGSSPEAAAGAAGRRKWSAWGQVTKWLR